MQGSARDALRHSSSQCQGRGLIRPQGDLWAALRAARSGCESFDAERQIVTRARDEKIRCHLTFPIWLQCNSLT